MNKAKILTILSAIFPTYCALFVKDGVASVVIFVISTLILCIITGYNEDTMQYDRDVKDKIQTAWILHVVGMLVAIAVKNIF